MQIADNRRVYQARKKWCKHQWDKWAISKRMAYYQPRKVKQEISIPEALQDRHPEIRNLFAISAKGTMIGSNRELIKLLKLIEQGYTDMRKQLIRYINLINDSYLEKRLLEVSVDYINSTLKAKLENERRNN